MNIALRNGRSLLTFGASFVSALCPPRARFVGALCGAMLLLGAEFWRNTHWDRVALCERGLRRKVFRAFRSRKLAKVWVRRNTCVGTPTWCGSLHKCQAWISTKGHLTLQATANFSAMLEIHYLSYLVGISFLMQLLFMECGLFWLRAKFYFNLASFRLMLAFEVF